MQRVGAKAEAIASDSKDVLPSFGHLGAVGEEKGIWGLLGWFGTAWDSGGGLLGGVGRYIPVKTGPA